MRTTHLLAALLIAATPALGSDPVNGDAPPLAVTLENVQEPDRPMKARMRVEGRAAHLPDGAIIHISLTVKDRHPDIQVAMVKAEVNGGRYSAVKEWDRVTFAPMEYTTVAGLNMLAQSPTVKAFLARELGYGAEHVETLGTVDTATGTPEERVEYALTSLQLMRDFVRRLCGTRERLTQIYETNTVPDGYHQTLMQELRGVMANLDDMLSVHVAAGEHHTIGSLKHTLTILSESWRGRARDIERAKGDAQRAQQTLDLLQRDIDARLPTVGAAPGGGGQ